MRVQVLSSGSAGNALLVRAGEIHVLVDAGLPLDELEQRLVTARVSPLRIDAVLVTHGHLDHARSVGQLARKAQATVYCAERVMKNLALRKAPRFVTLRPGTPQTLRAARGVDELGIETFEVPHDASPTYAFCLEHLGRRVLFVTDMGHVPAILPSAWTNPDVALIEFNHDRKLLAQGPYPKSLQRRVRGRNGHLSNDEAAELVNRIRGPRLHTLVLTHLSQRNNHPDLARRAAESALAPQASPVAVHVASQDDVGPSLLV